MLGVSQSAQSVARPHPGLRMDIAARFPNWHPVEPVSDTSHDGELKAQPTRANDCASSRTSAWADVRAKMAVTFSRQRPKEVGAVAES